MKKARCTQLVRSSESFRPRQCLKAGTVEERGKFYCKTHAPSLRKARQKERDAARWTQEKAAQARARRRKRDDAWELVISELWQRGQAQLAQGLEKFAQNQVSDEEEKNQK